MASHSQHQQGTSASKRSGGGQAVVELCEVTTGGLVFWSRQRFEIGAELQIRIRGDVLLCPCGKATNNEGEKWVTVRGFVVECPQVRREDGAHGFRVSLLLDSALMPTVPHELAPPHHTFRYVKPRFYGLSRMGLN